MLKSLCWQGMKLTVFNYDRRRLINIINWTIFIQF